MNTSGWGQLNCPYFATTCRRVLGSHLEQVGFEERDKTRGGGIAYAYADMFLELSHDVSLFPIYAATGAIGFGERAYSDWGAFHGVPMWYLLPEEHPYRTQVHWTFQSKDELSRVLREVRGEFIDPIVIPLIHDRGRLEQLISEFESERR